ncbi:Set1 complex component sdc1 [Colletotrichum chlorophyti]|uniref:Set1 complex component sdc1 n=1 Tax=Colletotrichum chlorophyti TaxID=708187 RepID=A0A1Q8RM10_9PEZI|nr:Set1 complex component sdc1 [Colletotrichum chlorophyti]
MPPATNNAVADAASRDITMTDAVEPSSVISSLISLLTSAIAYSKVRQSPAPVPQPAASAPSPAPARTGTPARNLNNGEAGSRAGSVHPDANAVNIPAHAIEHGDAARMYINNTVTAALLEGMKIIGREQPPNPLYVLSQFLLKKSQDRGEYHGPASGSS